VISGESRGTRCVMGRLEAGEEIVAALRELARVERIDAAFVRAQGAVDGFELARFDAAARRYVPAGGATGPAELVSLAGSVSLEPDGVGVRLWAVLAVAETRRAQAQPDEAVPAPQGAPRDERGSAAGTDLERAGGSGGRGFIASPRVEAGALVSARAVYVEFAMDVFDDGDLERRDDAATGLRLWRPPRRR
jgi:predicted DNA-binding protein with PD1-like motif